MFKIISVLMLACCLTSCTYNVSMAHTSGTADDVIDDQLTNTPNVSPTVNIPVTPGAGLTLPGVTK